MNNNKQQICKNEDGFAVRVKQIVINFLGWVRFQTITKYRLHHLTDDQKQILKLYMLNNNSLPQRYNINKNNKEVRQLIKAGILGETNVRADERTD